MTVTITKTVGTDGSSDYPSPDAWVADTVNAFPRDLVAEDVVVVGLQTTTLVGSGTLLTLSGHNTDPQHNIVFKPAPGLGFADNPNRFSTALNYNEAAGVGLRSLATYDWGNGVAIRIGDSNVSLEGLQVHCPNGAVPIKWDPSSFPGPYNWLLMDCIFRADGSIQSAIVRNAVVENCLFILNNGQNEIVNCTGNCSFYNSDLVEASDQGASSAAWGSDFSTIYVENSGSFGARTFTAGSSPSSWTWVNCVTDRLNSDPGNPQVFTGAPTVVPYANQFIDASFASGDFRTLPGSNLLGAGVPDLAHARFDILGTARLPFPDIGCYQITGVAPPPPPPPPPTCPPQASLGGGSGFLVAGLALAQAARRNRIVGRRRFLDPRRW